jgi:hypothetical protein
MVSVPAEKYSIHISYISPLIPQVVPTRLTLRGQRCIRHKDIFTSCGSGHKTSPGLYSPWVHGRDSSHDGCHPYCMIGTASSKPRLEATGPESTSLSTRMLTFLPWCRCVVTESKLRKVNTEIKSLLVCHLSILL